MCSANCWAWTRELSPSYATMARDCGLSRRTVISIVKSLEEKQLVVKTARRSTHGDQTSNLFRLFSADDRAFPPSAWEGKGRSAENAPPPEAPESVVQTAHHLGANLHHPVSPAAPPPSATAAPKQDQAVKLPTNNYGVVVEAEAEKVLREALARGVEIKNPVAYRVGVMRNLVSQATPAIVLPPGSEEQDARRRQRENCTTCDGLGLVDVGEAWDHCHGCSMAPTGTPEGVT